jgi:LasA protease
MKKQRTFRLLLFFLFTASITVVCSSGYITPASLTATAAVTKEETLIPTAFFVMPSDTPTLPPTPTDTPDPSLPSPTEKINSPTPLPTWTPTDAPISADTPPLLYFAQAGDTLTGLANRFNVNPFEIVSTDPIPETGFINPEQMLMIPQRLALTTSDEKTFPDSEVVYSPTAADFDVINYVNALDGYLESYSEYIFPTGIASGAEIVQRVALEYSINPRLLLSLLEYNSHWLLGQPQSFQEQYYPMKYISSENKDLHLQLAWAANQISIGYYQWRNGSLVQLEFSNGSTLRLAPTLNAGTVGVMYYFSKITNPQEWSLAMDPVIGVAGLHNILFEDPWDRAAQIEPLFPANLTQPALILPFVEQQIWAFTGGPHGAWTIEGSQASLDFAPGSVRHGCTPSNLWTVAAAPGVIARLGNGVVMLDLDGDGKEQTGWVLFYLHVNPIGSLHVGKWVDQGDLLGHPSCEGGRATGTHLHIARKYNGEWIAADGPIPFNLSGWEAHAGDNPYEGYLTRGDDIIEASEWGAYSSNIKRSDDDL